MNRYADDPVLQALRGQMQPAEDLLRGGIFIEPASGRICLAGRGDCTLRAEDLFFEAIAQIYLGWPSDAIVNGVLALLDAQDASGRVPRALPAGLAEAGEHAWPFLGQTALLVHNAFGDATWLTEEPYFSRLHGYLDYWLALALDELAYVDLSCHLVRECRAFARLADLAGQQALATAYARQAFDLAARVREACWDEQDGFFYDPAARAEEGSRTPGARRARWAGGFATLWSGVARTEQVKRLVFDYLFNAAEFWSPYPVASASRRTAACSPTADGAPPGALPCPEPAGLTCGFPGPGRPEQGAAGGTRQDRLAAEPGQGAGETTGAPGAGDPLWVAQVQLDGQARAPQAQRGAGNGQSGGDPRVGELAVSVPVNYMLYHGLRNYGYRELASLLAHVTHGLVQREGPQLSYLAESGAGRGGPAGRSLLAYFLPFEEQCGAELMNWRTKDPNREPGST